MERSDIMAKLWAKRLENPNENYNNFNQVPKKLQAQVLEILTADGYEVLEDGTVVKRLEES